jgi:hypothetical protein
LPIGEWRVADDIVSGRPVEVLSEWTPLIGKYGHQGAVQGDARGSLSGRPTVRFVTGDPPSGGWRRIPDRRTPSSEVPASGPHGVNRYWPWLVLREVGREALHAAHERVDPIEQRVFGAFQSKDQAVFREFLVRFIEAFEGK